MCFPYQTNNFSWFASSNNQLHCKLITRVTLCNFWHDFALYNKSYVLDAVRSIKCALVFFIKQWSKLKKMKYEFKTFKFISIVTSTMFQAYNTWHSVRHGRIHHHHNMQQIRMYWIQRDIYDMQSTCNIIIVHSTIM